MTTMEGRHPAPVRTNFSTTKNDAPLTQRTRLYPSSAKAPFIVYVRQRSSPIDVFDIVEKQLSRYKSVEEVIKVTNHKIKIVFTNRKEANEFVKIKSVLVPMYQISIPSHCVEVDGVISDQSIGTSDVIQRGVGKFNGHCMGAVSILAATRLAKFSKAENSFVPSSEIRITFSGTILPDFVQIDRVILPVRMYYYKPMYCSTCGKFGHTIKHCTVYNNVIAEEQQSATTHICVTCSVSHLRPEECTVFKQKSLKLKRRRKKTQKQLYSAAKEASRAKQQMSTHNTTNVSLSSSNSAVKESRCKGSMQQQNSNRTDRQTVDVTSDHDNRKPLFTMNQLIDMLCGVLQLDSTTQGQIRSFYPLISYFWKALIVKYPTLGLIVAT